MAKLTNKQKIEIYEQRLKGLTPTKYRNQSLLINN